MTTNDEYAIVPVNLFGVRSALDVIAAATEMAKPLAQLIEDRQLYTDIRGRRHVRVEGWTLLGSMLGVFPVVEWTRPVEGGWEARVVARTRDGATVGAAEGECLRSEPTWQDRPDFAIRSMAQTRTTSKALRLPLGFVIQLAGFETTPAEEMDGVEVEASGPPCPHCGAPVLFNDEKTRGRKPAWSCSNRGCGGGGLRDKEHPEKGNWPWGTYDADYFASGDSEAELKVEGPSRPAPPVTGGFDMANLGVLGITEDQARSELQAYKEHPGFAAGTVAQIRTRVEHAITLCVALGIDGEGLLGDLWAEWSKEDPARATITWGTAKARDVLDFAKAVQDYLRARL